MKCIAVRGCGREEKIVLSTRATTSDQPFHLPRILHSRFPDNYFVWNRLDLGFVHCGDYRTSRGLLCERAAHILQPNLHKIVRLISRQERPSCYHNLAPPSDSQEPSRHPAVARISKKRRNHMIRIINVTYYISRKQAKQIVRNAKEGTIEIASILHGKFMTRH